MRNAILIIKSILKQSQKQKELLYSNHCKFQETTSLAKLQVVCLKIGFGQYQAQNTAR